MQIRPIVVFTLLSAISTLWICQRRATEQAPQGSLPTADVSYTFERGYP